LSVLILVIHSIGINMELCKAVLSAYPACLPVQQIFNTDNLDIIVGPKGLQPGDELTVTDDLLVRNLQ
jgi:hypothetical protein